MKRLLPACAALLVLTCLAGPSWAQQPNPASSTEPLFSAESISGMVTPTPEMWLYLHQLQRYDDPKMVVRRKAEFKAAQRRNRIAARKYFGYSNLRPTAHPTPFTGSYSPGWIGNSYDPFGWAGQASGPTTVFIERSASSGSRGRW